MPDTEMPDDPFVDQPPTRLIVASARIDGQVRWFAVAAYVQDDEFAARTRQRFVEYLAWHFPGMQCALEQWQDPQGRIVGYVDIREIDEPSKRS